ncbi:hypothetical protein [Pseudomonas fluorescens]|uniref:Uncharacterized protein n=1 Tax=Pseudomonas fluorescens TaxID=294 RepID=A0A5E7U8R2_PSEFL|nr:hypothetical protein [Pseudomonas fluorescens]VVQ06829.1 hypothetical protein PS941_03183 [Pseudomonas fluorescens]
MNSTFHLQSIAIILLLSASPFFAVAEGDVTPATEPGTLPDMPTGCCLDWMPRQGESREQFRIRIEQQRESLEHSRNIDQRSGSFSLQSYSKSIDGYKSGINTYRQNFSAPSR